MTENKLQKTKTKKKNINVFKAFFHILPMVFKASPVLFISSQMTAVTHAITWGLGTVLDQRFFERATEFSTGETPLKSLISALTALFLINVTNQILNGIVNFLPRMCNNKARGKLSYIIHQKMARLALIDFEDTNKLDDINKAEQGKNNAVWFILMFMWVFTFYIPYFIFMSVYLFTLKPVLILSVLLIFVPVLFTQLIRTNVFSKLEDRSAPIRREVEYYEKCIADREYFKETRLLGAYGFFRKLYTENLHLLNKIAFRAAAKTDLIELAMKLLTVAGYGGVIYLLFDALMRGQITVGAFAAVFISLGKIYQFMQEVICNHLGNITQNLGTIQNFINFLDMKDMGKMEEGTKYTAGLPEYTNQTDIIVKNASFAYPNAQIRALDNINITIKNGETVAIVGENGSGKSTLVRLLTGLYTPGEGDVYFGSTNLKDISYTSVFSQTSAVFQKYRCYQMTLGDNITISQFDKIDKIEKVDKVDKIEKFDKFEKGYLEHELDMAAEMAGVFVKPDKPDYDTMLSREFDGIDLSGGQWQRIAIARGLYRMHRFIVLDEPTAAIDPFEETKIYNRFAEISKDKTAVIVTHRLGSVRLADRIIVLRDGRIAETGTNEELLAANGEYKKMYIAQQKWYDDINI